MVLMDRTTRLFFARRQGSDDAKQPDYRHARLFCHVKPPVKNNRKGFDSRFRSKMQQSA